MCFCYQIYCRYTTSAAEFIAELLASVTRWKSTVWSEDENIQQRVIIIILDLSTAVETGHQVVICICAHFLTISTIWTWTFKCLNSTIKFNEITRMKKKIKTEETKPTLACNSTLGYCHFFLSHLCLMFLRITQRLNNASLGTAGQNSSYIWLSFLLSVHDRVFFFFW